MKKAKPISDAVTKGRKRLFPGILFLLLAALAPVASRVAVTIEEIYNDDDDESVELGFGTLPERVSAGERDRTTITILDNDVAESGGGECAIARETGHGVAAVNLLLIVTVLLSVLLSKTRSTN